MTFWKKNGLQLLTLVLCAVLLGLNLSQRAALSEVKSQLDNAKHQLGDLNNSMNRISDRVAREMAESVRLVTAHDLQVTGVDSDSRSLLTWVSVTLRQWGTDTGAILLVNAAGETTEFPMTGRGDGREERRPYAVCARGHRRHHHPRGSWQLVRCCHAAASPGQRLGRRGRCV